MARSRMTALLLRRGGRLQSSPQPAPPPMLVHDHGRGCLHEVEQDRGEAPRVIVVGEMTCAREDLESTARDARVCFMRVTGGDERIVLAPDDQRWHLLGQIEPVDGADTLATQIDEAPHRVQERLAGVGFLERHEAAPDLPGRARPCRHRAVRPHRARAAPLRLQGAPPPGGADAARDRGRRSTLRRGVRSARETGTRTALRRRPPASARRSFLASRRARRAGREPHSRRPRASSLPAAWRIRRGPGDRGR
jgi:hypothetical protein